MGLCSGRFTVLSTVRYMRSLLFWSLFMCFIFLVVCFLLSHALDSVALRSRGWESSRAGCDGCARWWSDADVSREKEPIRWTIRSLRSQRPPCAGIGSAFASIRQVRVSLRAVVRHLWLRRQGEMLNC